MLSTFGHIIGFVGMICVVLAFRKVTTGAWHGQGVRFNVVNLIGAILLLISLCIHFNAGSFVIELFWIWISVSALRKHRQVI